LLATDGDRARVYLAGTIQLPANTPESTPMESEQKIKRTGWWLNIQPVEALVLL
jgi:hypothetical protein